MRVAILANVPAWTIPGLEHLHEPGHYATWLEPLIPAFQGIEGIEIHWITMSKKASKPVTHTAHGQTIHILPRGRMSISMATAYLDESRRINRLLKNLEPEVLHAWGSEDVYGIAAARSGIARRIFTLQGSLNEYLRLSGGGLLFRIQAAYEKATVRKFRYATAETPAARELLLKLHQALDVRLVDYGVHSDFFEATWKPSAKPTVLFVGSVVERKGIRDLIRSAADASLSHVTFKIAGDGAMREGLQSASPANVEWLGTCSRAEVVTHMSQAWALVVPTHADTGPTVVKEARVVGLPVVTTTRAGASCYIDDSGAGHVIEPSATDSIKEAITDICGSMDYCVAMGKRSWSQQRKELHANTTVRNFATLYREIQSLHCQSS